MKLIVLSFTLKNQDFSKIAAAIIKIKESYTEELLLFHGFMPREEVVAKKFSTDVVDFIENNFPNRRSFYIAGKVDRAEMAACAYNCQATVYVIGEVVAGVKEEVDLYEEKKMKIEYIPL